MLIDSLTREIERTGALDDFWGKLDAGNDSALGAAGSARPFLVAARFAHRPQPTLVVLAGEDASLAFARGVASYLGDEAVLRFPLREDVPGGAKAASKKAIARRMQAAHALQTGRNRIVVASAEALMRLMAPAKTHACRPLAFASGCELADLGLPGVKEFDDVPRVLTGLGYVNSGQLDGPGTYCVKGGVIDVFPGQLPYPIRLDFFGDELEEVRRIVPATGQTIATLPDVEVYPVREYLVDAEMLANVREALGRQAFSNPVLRELAEKLEGEVADDAWDALLPFAYRQTDTLGAYLHPKALVSVIEPRSIFDAAAHGFDEICGRMAKSGFVPEEHYAAPAKLNVGATQRATYVSLMRIGGEIDAELPVKRVDVAGHPDKLFAKLRSLVDARFTVVFSVPNFRVRQEMKMELVDRSIPICEVLDSLQGDACGDGDASSERAREPKRLSRSAVNIVDVEVPLGMVIPKANLAIVSMADVQGSGAVRRTRHVDITEITFPYKEGDYVVHAAHGVALFREIVRRAVDDTERDYLLLEYAEGDKLFVPVEQLDRVTRYVGPEGADPRLTRLNTADWSRVLTKARKATKKLAFDLVDVYSRRINARGYRFSADTPWQLEMEEAFPYQETPDQLAAIAEVKADMQSGKPMDRLVCGDVGFGKTEVALRAAFKATQDGKQVMVLCPTTILAQQHYTNFRERFAPFGVRVDVLSRFRTSAQQKESIEGFAQGSVQVLIGTHRLLSRDVNPHDLGLVIIDEEQRFGVGHKEQMKNMRESIDVLTLSATPIPRTMQMAVSGVRDMSLILTPPSDRRPVQVHVGEWDPDVVSGAIRRELARKGQVYYVSNRVRSIEDAVGRIAAVAPEARVGVAHGQMEKDALERVMEEFSAGELDVLVATTIIESGIDNPHTNTLIIEDSQRLGLAQMYQLKGRVGRSAAQAYAYFMFPGQIPLTEEATARLMAIDEHQELGSGMRIALRDLEIRGAGQLLGSEQSGNMSSVGFDLFAQMIATAVNATRDGNPSAADELPPALSDITVNIPGKAFLDEEYIPAADERVLWYRRIASAATVDDVDALAADLRAKRPEMPDEALNLFNRARVKAFANEHGVKTITVVAGKLTIEPIDRPKQFIPFKRHGARYFEESRKLTIPLKYFGNVPANELFAPIAKLLEDLFAQG